MNCTAIVRPALASLFCSAAVLAQSAPAAPVNSQYTAQNGPAPAAASSQSIQPVSYASVTQLNGMLGQLEDTSKSTQNDLTKLRIERWKTDGNSKKQALSNVESIERNLQGALPEIIATLRNSPEDVPATFKLYRNLDALYDVLGNVVELAGAFGSKDDTQSLSNDLNSFENTRRQIADRIETLSASKEAEIARLRADLKTAQAAIPAEPPKKIVVDDNEPPKKPAVKKKKPTNPPSSQAPAQPKPQS
jgi:Skp family chaperone for outer membrane proteins